MPTSWLTANWGGLIEALRAFNMHDAADGCGRELSELGFGEFVNRLSLLVHSRWRRTYGGNAHQTGRRAIIDGKRFEGNLVFLRARGPASLLDRYRRFREKV